MAIFDWLPWGVPGSYREVEVLSTQLLNHRDEFVWRLSEPWVQVLELGKIEQSSEVRLLPISYLKDWEKSGGGLNFLQTVDMPSSYQTTGDLYQLGNYREIAPMGPRYCAHNQCPPSPPPK